MMTYHHQVPVAQWKNSLVEAIGSYATKVQVSTWMGDHLVGCSSIVKRPYSSMSLTLEGDS